MRKKATCKYCYSIFLDSTDKSSTNDCDRCNEASTRAATSTTYNGILIKSKLPMGGLEFARDNEAITGDLGRQRVNISDWEAILDFDNWSHIVT